MKNQKFIQIKVYRHNRLVYYYINLKEIIITLDILSWLTKLQSSLVFWINLDLINYFKSS